MTQKKDNEKLIQELYEKLWWYTHEAGDEEFDEKEVDAIVRLLEVLEPLKEDPLCSPDVNAAYERFQKRYGLKEEPAGNPAPVMHRRGGRWKRRLVRFGIGAAACVILVLSVNLGTYALKKKSFFEIVRDGMGRTEVTVTGNLDEFQESSTMEAGDWEEVEAIVGEDILVPKYIPEGFECKRLTVEDIGTNKIVTARYKLEDNFIYIEIDLYEEAFSGNTVNMSAEWKLLQFDEKKEIQYYGRDDQVQALFFYGKGNYLIWSNLSLADVEDVVEGLMFD